MNDMLKLPFYAKLSFTLLSLLSIFTVLYIGQNIIIPILLSLLFAILLRPIAHFFKSKLHFPHVISVIFTVFLFIFIVIGVLTFISWQISDIANDWDKIKTNLTIHFNNIQEIVRVTFNLSKTEQQKLIDDAAKSSLKTGKSIVGSTLMSFTDTLLNLTLIPIYTFPASFIQNPFYKISIQIIQT
jgi:predicted PurR-regulated permease PerM